MPILQGWHFSIYSISEINDNIRKVIITCFTKIKKLNKLNRNNFFQIENFNPNIFSFLFQFFFLPINNSIFLLLYRKQYSLCCLWFSNNFKDCSVYLFLANRIFWFNHRGYRIGIYTINNFRSHLLSCYLFIVRCFYFFITTCN